MGAIEGHRPHSPVPPSPTSTSLKEGTPSGVAWPGRACTRRQSGGEVCRGGARLSGGCSAQHCPIGPWHAGSGCHSPCCRLCRCCAHSRRDQSGDEAGLPLAGRLWASGAAGGWNGCVMGKGLAGEPSLRVRRLSRPPAWVIGAGAVWGCVNTSFTRLGPSSVARAPSEGCRGSLEHFASRSAAGTVGQHSARPGAFRQPPKHRL